jgi:hypothetical protein
MALILDVLTITPESGIALACPRARCWPQVGPRCDPTGDVHRFSAPSNGLGARSSHRPGRSSARQLGQITGGRQYGRCEAGRRARRGRLLEVTSSMADHGRWLGGRRDHA